MLSYTRLRVSAPKRTAARDTLIIDSLCDLLPRCAATTGIAALQSNVYRSTQSVPRQRQQHRQHILIVWRTECDNVMSRSTSRRTRDDSVVALGMLFISIVWSSITGQCVLDYVYYSKYFITRNNILRANHFYSAKSSRDQQPRACCTTIHAIRFIDGMTCSSVYIIVCHTSSTWQVAIFGSGHVTHKQDYLHNSVRSMFCMRIDTSLCGSVYANECITWGRISFIIIRYVCMLIN